MNNPITRLLPVLVLLAIFPAGASASSVQPDPNSSKEAQESQFVSSPGLELNVLHRTAPGSTSSSAQRGLRAGVRCNSACQVSGTIEVDKATRIRVGLPSNVLGSRTVLIPDASEHQITVRLAPSVSRALAKLPFDTRVHLRSSFVATSGAGETARVSFR